MKTAFEFKPSNERRIAFPANSLMLLLVLAIIVIGFKLATYYILQAKLNNINAQKADIKMKVTSFVNGMKGEIPKDALFKDLEKQTAIHNLEIGGKRSVWTKLFNELEMVLPKNSAVISINNSVTGKPEFKASDRGFKVNVAIVDKESASRFYRDLTNRSSFKSLSFTPKGNIEYLGKKCMNFELNFIYGE